MSKVVLIDLLVEAKPKSVARTTEPTVKVRLLLAVAVIFNSCTTLLVKTSAIAFQRQFYKPQYFEYFKSPFVVFQLKNTNKRGG